MFRPRFRLVGLAAALLCLGAASPGAQAQVYTTLHSFNITDGADPHSSLIQASDGNLYGTTLYGGTVGYGTVFQITIGGAFTTLDSFDGTEGYYPKACF